MRVLIIGNGGREHAIAWKLRQSTQLTDLFFTPPNAGMEDLANPADINLSDFNTVKRFCKNNLIDLVAIGPEAPLVAGMSDALQEENITVFGPRMMCARIEGSKTFAKHLMQESSIPTAAYGSFTDLETASDYLNDKSFPIVVKADGLAAGKGVIVVENFTDGQKLLKEIFEQNKFGSAGNAVVIEEFLKGSEVSLLSFTDGITVLPMVEAQDYKQIYNNDEGPNTGGMGCYSPVPIVSDDLLHEVVNTVVEPTVYAMASRGMIFQGVLYTGLMLTEEGPKVLEYNARFGDPETQVILPRMKSDLLEIMLATANQDLNNVNLEFDDQICLSVVLASGGYPDNYQSGYEIRGLKEAEKTGAVIFHAGTMSKAGKVYTNGGRVLNVTAAGPDYKQARELAYEACAQIDFNYKYCRSDIGLRAIDVALSKT